MIIKVFLYNIAYIFIFGLTTMMKQLKREALLIGQTNINNIRLIALRIFGYSPFRGNAPEVAIRRTFILG